MTALTRTSQITAETSQLLEFGENERVDYKLLPNGLSAEDLVAFANGGITGHILLGVKEVSSSGKPQRSEIVGCDVSDSTILSIVNKSTDCIPPIAIDITIENSAEQPFIKITIPVAKNRPHCTQKGLYCVREKNRNRALHPRELLQMFLETEANIFAGRFEAVTQKLIKQLDNLESNLESTIDDIGHKLGWAESQLGDTESNISAILGVVSKNSLELSKANQRLRTLYRQDERDDPVRTKAKSKLIDKLVRELLEKPEILSALNNGLQAKWQASGDAAVELNEDECKAAFHEAIDIANLKAKEKDDNKSK